MQTNLMNDPFLYPVRVQIEDTDFTGLVYHPNYLNFMERARSAWIEQLGFGIDWQQAQKIYFLLHSVNIQFLKPAKLHEELEVVSSLKSLRAASMDFEQHLRPAKTPDKMLCKAEVKIVCVDFQHKPCRIPNVFNLEIKRREPT